MTFDSPFLLIPGLLVTAALVWAALVFARRRATALATAGVAANAKRRPQVGLWLSIAGLAVLAVAVAGPTASVPVPRASGTVILAMDVSNSMGAKDVAPTRLAAAQKAARSFIRAQPESVDIGVVAFEEGALTTARPSSDHSVAESAVDRLAVAGGTSLGSAIVASLSAITGKTVVVARDGTAKIGYWPSATIIMFSDGQDEGEGTSTDTAAAVAEKAGVHIDTVGVGTTAGSTVKVNGFTLQTALDEKALTSISNTTGGAYHPASDASELNGVASTINLRLTIANQQLPLAGAFIALALALLAAGACITILRTGRVI
jgi:Ca-activated chloride channel homolog